MNQNQSESEIIPQKAGARATDQLDDHQLDLVVGGKGQLNLHVTACKGTHIPEVTIEVW